MSTIMLAATKNPLSKASAVCDKTRDITSVLVQCLAAIDDAIVFKRRDAFFPFQQHAYAAMYLRSDEQKHLARDSVLEPIESGIAGPHYKRSHRLRERIGLTEQRNAKDSRGKVLQKIERRLSLSATAIWRPLACQIF